MSIALQQDATMEASIVRIAILDSAIAVILVGGVVSMVAYALWVTKRERSSYPSAPSELPYHPARS